MQQFPRPSHSTVGKLAKTSMRRAVAEALDQRICLSGGPEAILVLNGTAGNDTMRLSFDFVNNEFVSQLNGGPFNHWPAAGVTAVNMIGMGGNDVISLVMSNGVPIVVSGGDGDDLIIVGDERRNLSDLPGSDATLNGGAGNDSISVYDTLYTAASAYSITETRFDRTVWSGFTYGTDIEALTLNSANATNPVNITSTRANTDYTFQAPFVGDVFNFGNATSGVQTVRGVITLGTTTTDNVVNFDDAADTSDRTWSFHENSSRTILSGFAPAEIDWISTGVATINMMCTGGKDIGTIGVMRSDLIINTSAELNGRDELTFGNSTQGMQRLIQHPSGSGIYVDNGPGRTIVNFNNTADTVARTSKIDLVSGYNQLTGICPMTIWYDDNDASASRLYNGTGNDYLSIDRVGGVSSLTVDNAGGSDRVVAGDFSHTLQEIAIPLAIINTGVGAKSSIWLNNGGDLVSRATTVYFDAPLAMQGVVGLSPAGVYYDPATVTTDLGVTIIDGEASSTYHVDENRALLTIHNWFDHPIEPLVGIGNDAVTVGGSGGLDLVTASVRIRNLYSLTALYMNDTPTATAEQVTFAHDTIDGTLLQGAYLANPAPVIMWGTNEVTSPVTYHGSSGNDQFEFRRTQGAGIVVAGNGGDDSFALGALGNGLHSVDFLDAPMTLQGNAGENDTLTINNTNGPAGTFGVTPTLIERNSAQFLMHIAFEQINIHTANLGEQLTVTGNFDAARPDIAIYSGTGDDDFLIEAGRPDMTIELFASSTGSTGNDDLEASRAAASAFAPIVSIPQGYRGYLNIAEGARVNITGTIPAFFTTEFLISDGVLDVGSAGAVADYPQAGPSRLNDVQAYVTSGYNGGAWTGNGISSSAAIADPANNAVGYAESTDRFDSFPATFNGLGNIDNTAVLIYNTIPGDTNLDGVVDFNDLLAIAQNYGTTSGATYAEGDLNHDGAVDFLDLLLIAQNYGESGITTFSDVPVRSRMRGSSLVSEVISRD